MIDLRMDFHSISHQISHTYSFLTHFSFRLTPNLSLRLNPELSAIIHGFSPFIPSHAKLVIATGSVSRRWNSKATFHSVSRQIGHCNQEALLNLCHVSKLSFRLTPSWSLQHSFASSFVKKKWRFIPSHAKLVIATLDN